MINDFDDITEELESGAALPSHPATTTAKKITVYGTVHDAINGQRLIAGLHRNEAATLQSGQKILEHAYRYAIINRKIYHTRDKVTIKVKTELIDDAN